MTKESHAPSAAYWYGTSACGGLQKNVREKKKNVRGDPWRKQRAYGRKQKNVHGGTIVVCGKKQNNVQRIIIILKDLT